MKVGILLRVLQLDPVILCHVAFFAITSNTLLNGQLATKVTD